LSEAVRERPDTKHSQARTQQEHSPRVGSTEEARQSVELTSQERASLRALLRILQRGRETPRRPEDSTETTRQARQALERIVRELWTPPERDLQREWEAPRSEPRLTRAMQDGRRERIRRAWEDIRARVQEALRESVR